MSQEHIEKPVKELQDIQATPSSSIEKDYMFDKLNDVEETDYNPTETRSVSSQKPTKKQLLYHRFRKLLL